MKRQKTPAQAAWNNTVNGAIQLAVDQANAPQAPSESWWTTPEMQTDRRAFQSAVLDRYLAMSADKMSRLVNGARILQ